MPTQPMRAHHTFAADARSVSQARLFARRTLEEWGAEDLVDSATLLVSELVTNAVVHAGTTALLRLRLDAQVLRLEVEDRHPSRSLPLGAQEPTDAESGRGLLITSALASAWGVEYTGTSKSVWALCSRDMASARPESSSGGTTQEPLRVAAVEMSGHGVVTAWNPDATAMFGWTPEEVIGRTFEEMVDSLPGDRPPREPTTSAAAAPWQGTYAVVCKDGVPAKVFASHVPAGRGLGSVALLVPASRRGLLEHPVAAARASRTRADPLGIRDDVLQRLGIDDYLSLAVERVRDPISADASYLLLVRDFDDEFEVKAVSGLPDALRGTRLEAGSAGLPDPRTPHLPVVVTDLSDLEVPLLQGTGLGSLLVVPVVIEGRVIGALGAAAERSDSFADDQAVELQRFADSIAVAADRARLQRSERERRGWLSFIAEAGDLLAGSLDQSMTMAITGQIVVPRLASWCAVYLDDERGNPVLEHVWHADEQLVEPLLAALEDTSPDQLGDSVDMLLGQSLTVIRMVARGRQIGFLTLGRPKDNPLRSETFLVAESIARRAALAIDNARAHGALLAVGQALQQSLLPSSMDVPPGLDVGVVYEAAGEGASAGGDFYDLFAVGGGTWCFVVGDVCGKGAEAAAVTGLARHTIRALAQAGFPVPAVLERLNAAILAEGSRSRFLTLVCGMLHPEGRRLTVNVVNAGHPAPFVVRNGGEVTQIGRPQALLGVLDQVEYEAEEHVVERGEVLVVVTDGVLERRRNDHMVGEEGLSTELSRAAHLPAQAVAERIRQLVLDFTAEPPPDDMAIFVVRVGD
ncbi:SpoIIE family protein phosphatase [Knoellia sp. 3-2P3]|uniref:SpoIIE family protein phosphatase n=1 Tax=unclassified Knoellia TaxID=2618719 RepID=UPI0023DB83C7|nr:SpoIIE family protein phosphatase [Knoellia sp. 3-2P3]MDF2092661.1 SpoIIE family protein phosphatase [Knoellia sp. 3-2P3]